MKSEFLEGIDSDDGGTTVFLRMAPRGNAFLGITGVLDRGYYCLDSNETGVKMPEKLRLL